MPLLRWLLRSIVILAVFVPFAAALPVAALWLCRTPEGAECLFWTGPFSCCVLVLIYSQLSAAPWRQGRDAVHRWREANGGLLHTSVIAGGWMFPALFASFAAEFAMLFFTRPSPFGRSALPIFTCSPLALVWAWRRLHG